MFNRNLSLVSERCSHLLLARYKKMLPSLQTLITNRSSMLVFQKRILHFFQYLVYVKHAMHIFTSITLFIVIMFIIKHNVSRNSCVRKMQTSFADRLRRCSHLCLISRSSMLVFIIKRIYFMDMQCRCHCISMAQSLSSYYRITTALFILAIVIMFIIKQNVSRNSCVRKMQSSFADSSSHLCLIRSNLNVSLYNKAHLFHGHGQEYVS